MAIADFIPDDFNVSDEQIESITNYNDIKPLAVKLFTRAVLVVGRIYGLHCFTDEGALKEFDRNDAITAGLLLRLNKHLTKFHQQILQDDLEVASIIARTAIDTGISLCFLLAENNPENFDHYIIHSHKRSKKYLDSLREAVADGDQLLPNARIVVRDIQRSFEESGVAEQDITSQRSREWDGGGISRRAQRLGWEHIYKRLFTLTSDAVHGSWENLRTFHLESQGGGYFSIRQEGIRWTYEILVGMCEFISLAVEGVISLLPTDHPECSLLLEDIRTTFMRMAALYHKDQMMVAEEIAQERDVAGWEFANPDEDIAEAYPQEAGIWLQDGLLLIVNRTDCYFTLKVSGDKIEHKYCFVPVLIELENMWLEYETLQVRGTVSRSRLPDFLSTCMELERERLSKQLGKQLPVESQSIENVGGRICFYCEVPVPPVEVHDGDAVTRRLYLLTMLEKSVVFFNMRIAYKYDREAGRQKLLELAGIINESSVPIDVRKLKLELMPS